MRVISFLRLLPSVVIFLALFSHAFPVHVGSQVDDTIPPALVELSISPASVDVSAGSQNLTLTMRVTDELAGVERGFPTLTSPSGQNIFGFFNSGQRISGDAHDGVYQITVTVPQFSEAGAWRLNFLRLDDAAGNVAFLLESDLIAAGLPTRFQVISVPDDVIPPAIVELSINPTSVDVSAGSQNLTLTMRVTDELAGVERGFPTLTSPSGQNIFGFFNSGQRISGDAHDGVYQITVTVPQFSETGAWRLNFLRLDDAAGNVAFLLESDLIAAGLPTRFTVSINQPPVAVCRSITKPAGDSCSVGLSANEMDNGSFDPDGDPLTLTVSPAGPFSLGTTAVTLTVTDDEGASSTCTSTVTVVDTTPPIISNVPADITAPATSASGAVVTYLIPTAADSCDAAIAVDCSPQSGSTFPLGSTPVTCSAKDGSNNTSFENFTVNVLAADLVITKAAAPNPVTTRSNLTYLITITNTGPGVAFGVTVSDMIPAGATFVSASTGAGVSCVPDASGLLVCGLGDLPSGSSATVTLTVYVTAVANSSVSNTASVNATTYDPNMPNNTATITTPVTGGPPPDPGPPPSPGPPGGSPPRGRP